MVTKKGKKAIIIFLILFIVFTIFMPTGISVNAATNLSLTVSYNAKCGEPTTFTLNASGGTGNYMYYLGNITRDGEDGQYFVADPSRLPGYQASNKIQFTFCASGVYYLHFYVMDKGTAPIVTKRTIIKVIINDPAYPSIETIADNIAAKCMSVCKTEYERALWLHDWLVDNCSYDYSFLYCGSEGALARGKGTCEAYHRAYTMLLNRVGIANGRMEGNGHVWTAVRMDGKWYQVDVTWDDNGYSYRTYENYIYFGLSDTIMKMVHSDHSTHIGYESNALENNYLIKSGSINQWSDPLRNQLQQELDEGKTSFSIPINSGLPDSYKSVIYSLAAYQFSTQGWSTAKNNVKVNASYSADRINVSAVYMQISTAPMGTTATEPTTNKTVSAQDNTTSGRKDTEITGSKTTENISTYDKNIYNPAESETTTLKILVNGNSNEKNTYNQKESQETASKFFENENSGAEIISNPAESKTTDSEILENENINQETSPYNTENANFNAEDRSEPGNSINQSKIFVCIIVGATVTSITLTAAFVIRKRKL